MTRREEASPDAQSIPSPVAISKVDLVATCSSVLFLCVCCFMLYACFKPVAQDDVRVEVPESAGHTRPLTSALPEHDAPC